MPLLQQRIGNGAVNRIIAREAIRRDTAKPATLEEAIRTGDSDALKPFRPFPRLTPSQLLGICNIVLTNAIVGFDDERTLEEAWKAIGHQSSLSDADADMWERCVKRGADVRNVPWMRELQFTFAEETRNLATHNLESNEKVLRAEAARLGASLDGTAGTATPAQDAAMGEQQKLAGRVVQLKDTLAKLRGVDVGYAEGEVPVPAPETKDDKVAPAGAPGSQEVLRRHWTFDPDRLPPFRPTGKEQKAMAEHEKVKAVWDTLSGSLTAILNQNPALYALASVGDVGSVTAPKPAADGAPAVPGKSVAEARAEIEHSFGEVITNIGATEGRIAKRDLGFQHLLPVHDRLYATKFSNHFDQKFLKAHVVEQKGSEESMKAALGVAAIALVIAVEIGTAGAATPLIPALIGLTASGAAAASSWEQWSHLDSASKANVDDKGAVVTKEQADDALTTATIDTAMMLFDVFMVGKAANAGVAASRVAGLVAAQEATQRLARLATLPVTERLGVITAAVERDGVASVISRSGKSAEELVTMVGKDSAIGQRIAEHARHAATSNTAELSQRLGSIATLATDDADALIVQSIDTIGPARTVETVGGWAAVEARSTAGEGTKRLRSWRQGLATDLEAFMAQRRSGVPTSSGADDVAAARAYLSQRAGIPIETLEKVLGRGLGEIAAMEQTARSAVGIKHFFTEPADLRTRLNALIGIVNPILEGKGVPAAMAIFEKKGYMAFDKGPWTVEVLNKLLAVERLSEEQFQEVVSCVYHEARHAEQFWTIARVKAGEGKDVKWILDNLHVPPEVAELAVHQPIKGGTAEAAAASEWFESVFGKGALHRSNVYKNMDKAAKTLEDLTKHVQQLMDDGAPKKLIDLGLDEFHTAHEEFIAWDQAYRALPEEADAYLVQGRFRSVLDKISTEAQRVEAEAEARRLAALDAAMPSTVRPGKAATPTP